MIPIELEALKPEMVILEEDSYGNNVYVVRSEPYLDEDMLKVECEDVLTKEITPLGYHPEFPGYAPTLFQILPSAG